jgi:hypothetical protein
MTSQRHRDSELQVHDCTELENPVFGLVSDESDNIGTHMYEYRVTAYG